MVVKDLSYAGRYRKKFGRRLVTLGISNDSNQMEALKCFMSSSPAAEVKNFTATDLGEFRKHSCLRTCSPWVGGWSCSLRRSCCHCSACESIWRSAGHMRCKACELRQVHVATRVFRRGCSCGSGQEEQHGPCAFSDQSQQIQLSCRPREDLRI